MGKYIESFKTIIADNGMTTVRIKTTNNRRIYLHDRVNPELEAEQWLEKIVIDEHTVYVVYGFGLGYHIEKLLRSIPQSSLIYVIEPDAAENTLEIAKKVLAKPEWITDVRLKLMAGDLRMLGEEIIKGLREKGINNVFFASFTPSTQIFRDFYEKAAVEIPEKLNMLFSGNVNFNNQAGFQYIKNLWQNFPYIIESDSIDDLGGIFEGRPAIIVAAGPSLDKNVRLLADIGDKAVIVAAGSAIGALSKHGIKPHFAAAIDPFEISAHDFDGKVASETSLMASYEVVHELVRNYPGRCFFVENNDTIMPEALRKYMPSERILMRSASVAVTALAFAVELKANPIIFVGQDLALSPDDNGKSHADGIETTSYEDQMKLEVRGHKGEKLLTIPVLKEVLDVFRVAFANLQAQGVKIINATEGGAYIEGAEHLTLKEVIERYLMQYESKDFFTAVLQAVKDGKKCDKSELLYELSLAYTDLSRVLDFLTEKMTEAENLLLKKEVENAVAAKRINAADAVNEVNFTKAVIVMEDALEKVKNEDVYKQYLSFYAQSYFEAYKFNKSIEKSDYNRCKAYCELFDEMLFITAKVKGMLEDNINILAEKIKE